MLVVVIVEKDVDVVVEYESAATKVNAILGSLNRN